MNNAYYQYWGKASKDKEEWKYHLLVYHSLDVAAVGSVWLEQDRALQSRILSALGMNTNVHELSRFILFFLALHDLGKFDIRFQSKVSEVRRKSWTGLDPRNIAHLSLADIASYDHGKAGYDVFINTYDQLLNIKERNDDILDLWKPWIAAVTGHHGIIPTSANWTKPLVWEEIYNPDFNSPEFEGIKSQAGLNRFVLSVKQWVEKTNSRGIIAKAGRYGGTYAHKDIAFEFASWVSPQFKIYLIKEFQRLKDQEQKQLGWDIKRNLAKINYTIHTDAIKEHLIPAKVTKQQQNMIYASEADVLNIALFGITAKGWRDSNHEKKGNVRDYANIAQLICLSNLENLNALFISEGKEQSERLKKLNDIAIAQMKLLISNKNVKTIEQKNDYRQ